MVNLRTIYNLFRNGNAEFNQTLTYASSTTVTISGDYTAIIKVGSKIEFTQSATVKYGYITAVSYGSPNTTLTIPVVNTSAGAVSSVANATISSVYISSTPVLRDHPDWLVYTPSWTNITIGNATTEGRLRLVGRSVEFQQHITLGTTSSVTGSVSYTLPITAKALVTGLDFHVIADIRTFDAGAAVGEGRSFLTSTTTGNAIVYLASGTYVTPTAVNGTVPMTWANTDRLLITRGKYEI